MDDMFVIVSHFPRDFQTPIPELVGATLAEVGSSVTLTSLSNFLVFTYIGVGYTVQLLSDFGKVVALGVLISYFVMVDFFYRYLFPPLSCYLAWNIINKCIIFMHPLFISNLVLVSGF